jgi:hypothetical protein
MLLIANCGLRGRAEGIRLRSGIISAHKLIAPCVPFFVCAVYYTGSQSNPLAGYENSLGHLAPDAVVSKNAKL